MFYLLISATLVYVVPVVRVTDSVLRVVTQVQLLTLVLAMMVVLLVITLWCALVLVMVVRHRDLRWVLRLVVGWMRFLVGGTLDRMESVLDVSSLPKELGLRLVLLLVAVDRLV